MGGCTLLHISDLHFGGRFADRMADAVLEAAERIAPDAVVASGDLVEWAEQPSAWRRVRAFFDRFRAPVISVPGNHDLDRANLVGRFVSPFRAYRRHIQDDIDREVSVPGAHLVGLTSASRWTMDLGYLQRRQIDWACDSFRRADEAAARVLVVHHGTRSVWKRYFRHHLRGAKNLENPLFDTGVDLILTGHRHFWHTEQLAREDGAVMLWSQAGTATCSRRHPAAHANSFSVVKTAADRIAVGWWHFNGEGRFELAEETTFPRRVPAGLLGGRSADPRAASG
ncbi:MAG TPA: metallophosphoesterase [Kofleriaceae bacterium]